MWATADESRASILDLYRAAAAHADETITSLPLDATGHVPWWPQPEVTLHGVLVHVLAETSRHAGHADILREQLDGSVGLRQQGTNVADHDERWWRALVADVEAAAREASG